MIVCLLFLGLGWSPAWADDFFARFDRLQERFYQDGAVFRRQAVQEWEAIAPDRDPQLWMQYYLVLAPLGDELQNLRGPALRAKAEAIGQALRHPELDLRLELSFLEQDSMSGQAMAVVRPHYEDLLKKAQDQQVLSTTLLITTSFAGYLYTNSELKRALELCQEGLELVKRLPRPQVYDSLNLRALLAMIFRDLGDNRKSDEIFIALLQELRGQPYSNLYVETLYNYANRTEDLTASVQALKEVIRITAKNHDTLLEAIALRSLASSFTAMDQPAKALDPLNRAIDLMQTGNLSSAHLITALRSRAEVHNRLGQWQAAITDCEQAVTLTPAEDEPTLIGIEQQWMLAYEGLKDYQRAYAHQTQLRKLMNRVHQREKKDELNQLSVQMGLKLEEEKSAKLRTTVQTVSALLVVVALAILLLGLALSKSRSAQRKQGQLQRMTQHVQEGIINIRSLQRIETHISPHIMEIVGPPATGQTFLDRLWQRGQLSADSIHMLEQIIVASIDESMESWGFNAGNLPSELAMADSEFILALDWHPIPSETGTIISILLAIRDSTEHRRLERLANRAAQQTQLYATRIQEVQTTGMVPAYDLLNKVEALVIRHQNQTDKAELKRELHLIKGIARSLGWQELRDAVHSFEDRLASDQPWATPLLGLETIAARYREVFDILHGGRNQKLGAVHPHLIEVLAVQYPQILQQLRTIDGQLDSLIIDDQFCCWEKIPREILDTALVHGLSNAIDHGFIRPVQAGRSQNRSCRLKIRSEVRDERLHIRLEDNGFGLDFAALRRIATERGLSFSEESELIPLLLLEGVSTAQNVSHSSGRGVGLSAIAAMVRQHAGEISLQANATAGVSLELSFSLQTLVKTSRPAA